MELDSLIVVDNSKSSRELILEISNGIITFKADNPPDWVVPITNKYNYEKR
jgi:hypothetical protein